MFYLFLLWRVLWAGLSQSWYVPDETWQSVEVSHNIVYGSGYLTWEWTSGIRSSLHPLLFSLPLQVLKLFGLDSQTMVVIAPKLVQAALTSLGEARLAASVLEREGRRTANWLMVLLLFNWHGTYTGSRTLINTLEYSLTCLSLSLYTQSLSDRPSSFSSLSHLPVVLLTFLLRPTSALVWAPLVAIQGVQLLRSRQFSLLLRTGCLLLLLACLLVGIDSLFYGEFTLTTLNFFLINVYHNLGVNYGRHPWYWYLSHALPPLLGPLLLPLTLGLGEAPGYLSIPVISNIVFLSLLPHKEMRFLQVVFPFLFCIIAKTLARFPYSRLMKVMFIMSNLSLTTYLSLVHQRGVVDMALWLGSQGRNLYPDLPRTLFLTPCHSTPLYSHIHYTGPNLTNSTLRFLRCEPNLEGVPAWSEEADQFYSAPLAWLQSEVSRTSPPDIIVAFQNIQVAIQEFLTEHQYSLCHSLFHTHFPEGRVGERILAFCHPSYTPSP